MKQAESIWGEKTERWAYGGLLFSAFTTPFSLPAGRAGIAAALLLCVVSTVLQRRRMRIPATGWLAFLFIGISVLATSLGVNPLLGLGKIDKLFWFLPIPVVATLVSSRKRLQAVLTAVAAGAVVLALKIFVGLPFRVADALGQGWAQSVTQAVINLGSMTDGQRLLVSIPITLGLGFIAGGGRSRGWILAALALQGVAMVVMFKRGSWVGLILVVSVFLGVQRGWKPVLGFLAAALLVSLAVPAVRDRIIDLRLEGDAKRGGRLLMWTKVAPELVRQHPMGMGYRCLTNKMMRDINRKVEPRRDHLHSNVLQVLVETGWLGLAVYLVWMAAALRDGVRSIVSSRPGGDTRVMAWIVFLSMAGLVLNGVVEYNLGDSEIVQLYVLLIGMAAARFSWAEGGSGEPERRSL